MTNHVPLIDRIGKMFSPSNSHECPPGVHRQSARLGIIHGAEWMHCRLCGAVWARPVSSDVRFSRTQRSYLRGASDPVMGEGVVPSIATGGTYGADLSPGR